MARRTFPPHGKDVQAVQGLTLKFTPERIDIAHDGDMAADFGKVAFWTRHRRGYVEETGKYVVVWKKVRGVWNVLYDCYNMNQDA